MNVADIPRLVDEGLFDGYFLRPVPIFTQTMLSRFNINAVGDLLIAVPMCAYAVVHVDVAWTPGTALFLASAIVGAVLLEAGVQMIAASFLLRSPGTRVVFFFIDELFGTFGNYPLTILPWLLQGLLTFVLPLAFLAYFPVAVVLDLPPRTGFLSLLAHVAPLVGFGVFFAARRVWAHNLRAFVSVGG
jgi:ABC-2 type transport system permease protein